MIELKDVSKIYNGKVIFEDVNLKIKDAVIKNIDQVLEHIELFVEEGKFL